jgi:hypothetical protein
MINTPAGKHHACFEVVSLQVGHFRQNLGHIEAGREEIENVADSNSHPPHAGPPSALPGINGDPFQ